MSVPEEVEIERVRERASLVSSADEVSRAIERMAVQISAVLSGRCPVILPIMTGGMFTAVSLCRHLDFAYEVDFLQVGRYGTELTGGAIEWHVRPRVDLEGRTVLLVDDVLDRGVTLADVMREIRSSGVADLRVAVLVSKDIAHGDSRPAVDFVGLHCPDRYLFGCGMDYKGFWRGLPALYAIDGV